VPRSEADRGDLADVATPRLAAAQAAIDALRDRYGMAAIGRGRGFGGGKHAPNRHGRA
jgi:DNA polymerase-4